MKKMRADSRGKLWSNSIKSLIILLLALLSLSAVSCSGNFGDSETTQDTSNKPPKLTEDEGMISAWVTNSFTKIQPQTAAKNQASSIDIYMAKNERESCQIVFRSDKALSGCSLEITPPENGLSCEAFREHMIETKEGHFYPDPLAPARDGFTIGADSNLVFLLRFAAAAETQAGIYNAGVKLVSDSGETLASVSVNVKVWDFALPEKSACATAVGLYPEFITKMDRVSGEALDAMYEKYYNLLLDYKVCAYNLPFDILDDHADAYMSDPRVTAFVIPYSGDDDVIRAYYTKLSSNPEWFDKAVFYPLDEPTSKQMLDDLAKIADRLKALFPDYKMVTPFFLNLDYDADTDQISFMTDVTNVWCPKSYMYITANIYSNEQIAKYPSFGARMAERKAAGDRVWWYVCWEPGDPYCNMFVDMDGIQHRLLFWQQKYYDVDGFLYWGSNYWRDISDPWTSMMTVPFLSETVFGDGSLLYNGSKAGIDGACGSVRLEAIRDGIEDFDMFTLAEEVFGREWVMDKIAEITSSVIKYTKSEEKFTAARIAVGDALDAGR